MNFSIDTNEGRVQLRQEAIGSNSELWNLRIVEIDYISDLILGQHEITMISTSSSLSLSLSILTTVKSFVVLNLLSVSKLSS